MLKAFPDMEIERSELYVFAWIEHEPTHFDLKWWNEEYKEPNHIADAGKMVGKWQQINKNEVNVIPEYRCSNCGAEFKGFGFDFDYCPRCGSVMEDEE